MNVKQEENLNIAGTVFDIQRYSLHDGEGIRTTVFLKGCPLRCQWCANPESQNTYPEIARFSNKCTLCLKCIETCPAGALALEGGSIKHDRSKCLICGKCILTCGNNAISIYGYKTTVKEVIEIVEKDSVYYELSGGGMTLSGGEPTMQKNFCIQLLKAAASKGIGTAIETCGFCDPADFEEAAGSSDMILFDLKIIDDRLHQTYTGSSNKRIKQNLIWLVKTKRCFKLRIPVMQGINTTEESLAQLVEFFRETGFESTVELLPYHRLGIYKYRALGRQYALEGMNPPSADEIAKMKIFIENSGYKTQVDI